jgi:hypothetical protein
MAKKSTSQNATLKRLTGTPFKTGSELKAAEVQILKEEWKVVERARVRRNLFRMEKNKELLAPFLKGFQAKFVNENGAHEQVVKVYLTEDEAIQVEIENDLKVKDYNAAIETIVKSLVEGFMGGYFKALGLKAESGVEEMKPKILK